MISRWNILMSGCKCGKSIFIIIIYYSCLSLFLHNILTTGHLKNPAGSPDHGQTQHRAVQVQLIFGEGTFNPHGNTDTHTHKIVHNSKTFSNYSHVFTHFTLIPSHSPSLWIAPEHVGRLLWGPQQAAGDAIKASATMHLTVCRKTMHPD